MPVDRHDPSHKLAHPECPVIFTDTREFRDDEDLDVGYNGFAVLTFEGSALSVEYRDITGTTIYTERWATDPASGSPVLTSGGPVPLP
jgi:hypothetical protein